MNKLKVGLNLRMTNENAKKPKKQNKNHTRWNSLKWTKNQNMQIGAVAHSRHISKCMLHCCPRPVLPAISTRLVIPGQINGPVKHSSAWIEANLLPAISLLGTEFLTTVGHCVVELQQGKHILEFTLYSLFTGHISKIWLTLNQGLDCAQCVFAFSKAWDVWHGGTDRQRVTPQGVNNQTSEATK